MMTSFAAQPLKGIKVLELAQIVAGPFAASLLGDFGADVIKVELPGVGDPQRQNMLYEGESLTFPVLNRNKRSITLDVRSDSGRRVFLDLVEKCDIVIENFRPGTLDRWGLGFETLRKTNPGVILLSISGFGQTGPYSDKTAFGKMGEALGGLTYISGFPDRPPVSPPFPLGDYAAGLFGTIGILLALRAREQGIAGAQHVDATLYESVFRMLHFLVPQYQMNGTIRERREPWSPNTAPSGFFETRDKKWVGITCPTNRTFSRLCEAMEQEELLEKEEFSSPNSRKLQEKYLYELVANWTKQLDAEAILSKLESKSVPCALCYSIEDIWADEHYRAREAIARVAHEQFGDLHMPNAFPLLSETPGGISQRAPLLGEHNLEVYSELLGWTDVDLQRAEKGGYV